MEIPGYIASLFMGVVLGLMGGGGSILTVPILVYLFGLTAPVATGYSLFVVGLAALIGGTVYTRKGEVDFRTGFVFAVPSTLGVNLARGLLLPALPEEVLSFGGFTLTKPVLIMSAFALMMIWASYSMLRKRPVQAKSRRTGISRAGLLALEGFAVGTVAGFLGAGGGFLIIPALVLLAGLPMRTAVGTSLVIIAAQSLLGFAGDLARGMRPDWIFLGAVTALAAVGIAAGSAVAHRINEQKLKLAFGWFVLLMGGTILTEQIHRLL